MEATIETQTNAIEEQIIKSLWTALQVAEGQTEKRGIQFGEALYKFREKSEVVPGGTTFRSTLDKLNIPPTTAYRWIAKYEEFIGTRSPKPNPDNRPSETASYEVKVEAEAEATAQASSMDVSSDEDYFAEDAPPQLDSGRPESEPETTPPTTTPTPVRSYEERNREELRSYLKRMNSFSIATKQVASKKAKWSKYPEYAEIIDTGNEIVGDIKLL
jgi:hypothetical protein